MPRPLCLYHKNCLDGSGSAAVVQRLHGDVELIPCQYDGMVPPRVEGRLVYVVDFALPIEHLRALKAQAKELVWLDHHATALDIRSRLDFGTLDVNECGASLTWRHCFPHEPEPEIIRYIRDKDLWRWELPDSRFIAAGLGKAFANSKVDGILDADLHEMKQIGRLELAKINARAKEMAATGIPLDAPYGLSGVRALAIPCNRDQNEVSEVVTGAPPEGLGYDLAIMFYRKGGKGGDERWVHSLRSAKVDCGKIASAFGGGGHPASACYVAPRPIVPLPTVSPVGATPNRER